MEILQEARVSNAQYNPNLYFHFFHRHRGLKQIGKTMTKEQKEDLLGRSFLFWLTMANRKAGEVWNHFSKP
jgi:hypothetical protein